MTAAPLPEPGGPVMRYDRFDPTGEASTPGSYAFLMLDGDATRVVETYEELRTESTVMRVHPVDADGVSHAAFYDGVGVGDVVEWREAEDCWTRYEVMATPVGASVATRDFGVEWLAYAGTGCAGPLSTSVAVRAGWGPPVIASRATGSRAVTLIPSPIRYGPYLLIPSEWEGVLEPFAELWTASPLSVSSTDSLPKWPSSILAEVRQHPLWREPTVPAGWALTGHVAHDSLSLSAAYEDEDHAVAVHISWSPYGPRREYVSEGPGVNLSETLTIDGHPAVLWYDPTGTLGIPVNEVSVYDEATGIQYVVAGYTFVDIDTVVAIARSLFESPNPPRPYTRNLGARGDRNAMRSTGSPATEASMRPERS